MLELKSNFKEMLESIKDTECCPYMEEGMLDCEDCVMHIFDNTKAGCFQNAVTLLKLLESKENK